MVEHKWVPKLVNYLINYCRWQQEVMVIDREEGIFLSQVSL